MNRYKKSSGSKFQWRPAKPPVLPKPVATSSQPIQHKEEDVMQYSTPDIPPQTLNAYLGPRGYTIPKSELTEQQLKDLRKTLTVRPVTGGAMFGAADAVEYPIYRESSNKIYALK
jgi:hypothetical protein